LLPLLSLSTIEARCAFCSFPVKNAYIETIPQRRDTADLVEILATHAKC
jgi:hypothetical protein